MVASLETRETLRSPSIELDSLSGQEAAAKVRHRAQALLLDAWIQLHSDNLYPSREEKERLATDMNMSYIQVNRWFANRRRKQTKRRKTEIGSPTSSVLGDPSMEHKTRMLDDGGKTVDFWNQHMANVGMQHLSVIRHERSCDTTMTDPNNNNNNNNNAHLRCTPPATYQQVPDLMRPMGICSPLCTPEHQLRSDPTKMLPTPPAFSGLSPSNPFLLAAALGLQQPWLNPSLCASLLPWLNTAWPGSQRDSSDSELSELSPRPSSLSSSSMMTPIDDLTEKENIAVAVLASLAMQRV